MAQLYKRLSPNILLKFRYDALENLKRQIHELIVKSYELRDESNAQIDEATQILIDELNLPPIEGFATKKNFSVKLSDLRGRLDASFYLPIVEKIISHLKQHAAEVTTIGDNRISAAVILPGRFKRVYVDENHGRIFIGGKQIGELDPSNRKYLSFVPKHWDGRAMTHDIIRLIPHIENFILNQLQFLFWKIFPRRKNFSG